VFPDQLMQKVECVNFESLRLKLKRRINSFFMQKTFLPSGHKMELELSCNESIDEATAKLLPPDSYRLPSGRATMHKIYQDKNHPSRLILPVIPKDQRVWYAEKFDWQAANE
jgi:hypothetical protein